LKHPSRLTILLNLGLVIHFVMFQCWWQLRSTVQVQCVDLPQRGSAVGSASHLSGKHMYRYK